MKKQKQIQVKSYTPGPGFIADYQKLVKNTIIPYQYEVINDRAEGAAKSHVVANFVNAGRKLSGLDTADGFYGMVFQDSDAAKWIEAAAYSLSIIPDDDLERQVDGLIDVIEKAQDKDGYLNTYFTIKDEDKRWTNLLEGHELYCAGHMMEAACAYYEATGKDKLLKVMQKNAEHIYKVFIEDKHPGYPGHPEIELALMKMYRLTGDGNCLELAKHFVDIRGVDNSYFEKERAGRSWTVWGSDGVDKDYAQSSVPLRDMKDVRGHAVRAVYLLTGMADIATETGDEKLFSACKTMWDSICDKQLYITGGIGSTVHNEAFSVDYDLPSDTAYNETCASIGLMFFASRMLEQEPDSRYSDVMERAFYNTVLAGIQQDGKRFFYVNPLEVIPGISGVAPTHKHDLPQRPGWYDCACCPPNAARLISSIGKYAYSENENTLFCHLYAAGSVKSENGLKVSCETAYPKDFDVKYTVLEGKGELAIRIPAWSMDDYSVKTGKPYKMEKGYIYINVDAGDEIEIKLCDKPYLVYASNKVPKLTGQAAMCRGPIVYCFEGKDNVGDVLSLIFRSDSADKATFKINEQLKDAVCINVPVTRAVKSEDALYFVKKPVYTDYEATAVPYYAWGNRGENQMRVWLPIIP